MSSGEDFFEIDTSAFGNNEKVDEKVGTKVDESRPVIPASSPTVDLRSNSGADISSMLTLDLETGPDFEREHLFDLPPVLEPPIRTPLESCGDPEFFLEDVGAVHRIKDALISLCPCEEFFDAILLRERRGKNRKTAIDAIDIERKNLKIAENAKSERLKLLSTSPQYARIIAIGFAIGDGEPQGRIATSGEQPAGDAPEEEILEEIWSFVDSCSPLVGFCILAFDLPVVFFRSMILGVKPSRRLSLSKYRQDEVLDLYEAMGGHYAKVPGLKTLARLLGIPVPAEGVDGGHAWRLYREDPKALREYQVSDVVVTREVFWKGSGMWWV